MANVSNLKDHDDVSQQVERLRAEFMTLSDAVTRLASESAASVQSQMRDTAARAAHKVSAAGAHAYQDAAKLGHDAVDTAHVAVGKIEAQIARNPMTAVLAALGFGFVVGLLSRRQQ